jgi:hypothetical protein
MLVLVVERRYSLSLKGECLVQVKWRFGVEV